MQTLADPGGPEEPIPLARHSGDGQYLTLYLLIFWILIWMRVMLVSPMALFNRTMHSIALLYITYFCNRSHWGISAGKLPRPLQALHLHLQSVTH